MKKKTGEHEDDNDRIIVGSACSGPQRLRKKDWMNRKSKKGLIFCCIVKICYNTEKSPGDQRTLAVSPAKDHRLKLM